MEYVHHYSNQNKEKIQENKERYKPWRNELNRNRWQNDLGYRIKCNLRNRLYIALNGTAKSCKTIELLGCTLDFFKSWITFQFYDGMEWNNYGQYFHLDNVRPYISFDLVDPEQQMICFNWKNMAPLRADKNISKHGNRNMFTECLQELKVKVFLSLNNQQ